MRTEFNQEERMTTKMNSRDSQPSDDDKGKKISGQENCRIFLPSNLLARCRLWFSCVCAVLCACVVLGGPLLAATPQRPNFVFILGEGHGWSSTSVRMDDAVAESKSSFVRTPNFEKLAQAGMRFASFYAPSPRCTPSRVTYFTGKSPAQLHTAQHAIGPASAILLGDFKLIRVYETGALELFNIAKDPGERRDLAQQMPDKVKELDQRLTDYLTSVNAQMPTKNPNCDPSKPTAEPKRGKGKGGKKNR